MTNEHDGTSQPTGPKPLGELIKDQLSRELHEREEHVRVHPNETVQQQTEHTQAADHNQVPVHGTRVPTQRRVGNCAGGSFGA